MYANEKYPWNNFITIVAYLFLLIEYFSDSVITTTDADRFYQTRVSIGQDPMSQAEI
jgi:hypothetical protein